MAKSVSKSPTGTHYVIAYKDSRGRLSFRVVQYTKGNFSMWDCGIGERRSFKKERVMLWRKIRSTDAGKAVRKYYAANGKVKYYRFSYAA